MMEDNAKCHLKVLGLIKFYNEIHIVERVPLPTDTVTRIEFYNILNWLYGTASYESVYSGSLCKRKREKGMEELIYTLLQQFTDIIQENGFDNIPETIHPNHDLLNNTIIGPTSFTGSCNVSDSYNFTKWMLINIPNSEDGYIQGLHFYTKDNIVGEIPDVMLGIYDYEFYPEKPENYEEKNYEVKVGDNVTCNFDNGSVIQIYDKDIYDVEYEDKNEIKNYIVTRCAIRKCWSVYFIYIYCNRNQVIN